jgi:hypothetical protein
MNMDPILFNIRAHNNGISTIRAVEYCVFPSGSVRMCLCVCVCFMCFWRDDGVGLGGQRERERERDRDAIWCPWLDRLVI